MSSMTDIVFLLLIFFMLTSTLVSPNALKLLFPNSKARTLRSRHYRFPSLLKFNSILKTDKFHRKLRARTKARVSRTAGTRYRIYMQTKQLAIEHAVQIMDIAYRNKLQNSFSY